MSKIYHLGDQGFLKIEGPEAIKFMQGYTTCDLTVLDDGDSAIGALCNIQGRMVTSFLLVRTGDDLILRMHRPLVATTMGFLKKYTVFSKAELKDISEDLACYGLLGDSDDTGIAGNRIHLGNRTEIWATDPLEAESDSGPWLQAEYEAGVAWVTAPTSEEHLPQVFNYHHHGGIDFEKGCYLGQEIVARAHYRGKLKQRLHRLVSNQARNVGDDLDPGTIVASAPSGQLAVLKNDSEDPITATFDDGEEVIATPC